MRCRPFLRAALFVALACSFGLAAFAAARADEICPAEVRHLPMAGTEAPGTYDLALIAETPRTVVAEWAAYTDHGFLTATLPPLRLEEDAGPSGPGTDFKVRSRTFAIQLPAGTKVYESWLRAATVTNGDANWVNAGRFVCYPPSGDPLAKPRPVDRHWQMPVPMAPPNPTFPAIVPVDAPNLERVDCPHPFVNATVPTVPEMKMPINAIGPGTVAVEVIVDPAGRLVDAIPYGSSGENVLDAAAIKEARGSTYTAPIAFCRPVFGRFTFLASFGEF